MLQVRKNFRDRETDAKLYLCSTPIGNLQDVSLRLLDVLRNADVIAAEDTRQTRKLLAAHEISPRKLVSYHEHNHRDRAEDLVAWWSDGRAVALVTDAGTPGVSDPGYEAVLLALEHNVAVIPVPGPSAVISALVASGLPTQPFTFLGFLDRDRKRAAEVLRSFSGLPGTLALYESPHRLVKTLRLIDEELPHRPVVLAKELTKIHETFLSGDISELIAFLEAEEPRGEYVIVVGPSSLRGNAGMDESSAEDRLEQAVSLVREFMGQGISHTEAVRLAAAQTGSRRKRVYQETIPEVHDEDESETQTGADS